MPADRELDAIRAREQAFHDAVAEQRDDGSLAPRRSPDVWERALGSAAMPIEGATVLELGCGDGEITMQLVNAGAAHVTAIDLSPGMVDLARKRMEAFRPDAPVRFAAAPAEETGLPSAAFDLIVGKFVLHHLDWPQAVEEIARLLKPGGRAVFIETSALNPLLRFARKHLTGRFGVSRLGTPDEHPLTRADIDVLRARFRNVTVDFPNFFLFHVFDRNVLRFRFARITKVLYRTDVWIRRNLPALGRLSYYMRVRLEN
jgi:ubiquinone/menaquinone biosynthesis C-methylase UbiE